MKESWTDVKRVFEALSYIVKGMSPDGTELFYTISYDAWLRRDPTELCEYLEKKPTGGQTDIKYRLNLQLQTYRAKITAAKAAAAAALNSKSKKLKDKATLRPMSIYILTNGDWAAGNDPSNVIKEMADFLVTPRINLKDSQLTIQFVSFAKSAAALKRINDLARDETNVSLGLDMVDCTPWTGNVLKMLRGSLDRNSFAKGELDEKSEIVELDSMTLPPLRIGGESDGMRSDMWADEFL